MPINNKTIPIYLQIHYKLKQNNKKIEAKASINYKNMG